MPETLSPRQIETARAIVAEWGEFCGRYSFSGQIRDEADLPFPKAAIRNSLLIVAGVEKDPEIIAALPPVALVLAYFQPNIGEKPLSSTGADIGAITALQRSAGILGIDVDGDMLLEALGGDTDNRARYEELIGAVRKEAAMVQEQLDRMILARL